jgi:MYXO-CTERM domain-containing protein
VLERIAGEPGSGAPADGGAAGGDSKGSGGGGGGNGASGGGSRPAAPGEESPNAISAAVSAASDPGGPGIVIPLVAALAVAFTIVALIRRRRSDS